MEINLEQLEIDERTSPHPLKGDNSYTIYFVAKVALLTMMFAIVWMLLFPIEAPSYNDHTDASDTPGRQASWEKNTTATSEEVDSYIAQTVEGLIIPEHQAAPQLDNAIDRFEQICTQYDTICRKTTRDGTFDDTEYLTYQAIIIHLINTVNKLLDTQVEKNMHYIKVHSDTSPVGRRGSATDTYVKMNVGLIDIPKEFWQVLTHEIGHIIDFTVIDGRDSRKDTIYTEFGRARWPMDDPSIDFYRISWINENTRRSSASYRHFVSGYGMRGMYEDFAEAHNLWFNHQAYFEELASTNTHIAEKYAFFENFYRDQSYRNLGSNYPSTNERIWDTTKLE